MFQVFGVNQSHLFGEDFHISNNFDPSRSVPGKMMFPTLCSDITALQPDPPRNPTPPGICTASLEPALLKKNSGQQDIATSREGALMAFVSMTSLFSSFRGIFFGSSFNQGV